MAKGTVRILRVRRTDDSSQHLLLHITQANAARPLDLKLVATEHEHIYHGSIKSTQINSLRSDHFTGDEDELRDMLLFSLLQIRPDGSMSDTLQGLETVAAWRQDTFEVTIRKNIGGITQRLASLALVQDDEREEILAFEWVESAVQYSETLQAELGTSRAALQTQQGEIDTLKSQLNEFIKLKKAHEDDMLQKFAALLNTKKRRIRELRSQLGDANVAVDEPMTDAKDTHGPLPSRRAKRKASQHKDADIDVDEADVASPHNETPQQTEDEDEDAIDAPPVQLTRAASQQRHFTAADLPPDRELPFKSKGGADKPHNRNPVTPEPEDEETEDEL